MNDRVEIFLPSLMRPNLENARVKLVITSVLAVNMTNRSQLRSVIVTCLAAKSDNPWVSITPHMDTTMVIAKTMSSIVFLGIDFTFHGKGA
jgi:hypothetical protein